MPHVTHHDLPADLRSDLERAGYFPDLVADVAGRGARPVSPSCPTSCTPETTFDADAVRRHITSLVLTQSRLVVAHADDHAPGRAGRRRSSRTRPRPPSRCRCPSVRSVVLNHVVPLPQAYRRGSGSPRADADDRLGRGQPRSTWSRPPAATPTARPTTATRARLSADDISLRVSARTPTARRPCARRWPSPGALSAATARRHGRACGDAPTAPVPPAPRVRARHRWPTCCRRPRAPRRGAAGAACTRTPVDGLPRWLHRVRACCSSTGSGTLLLRERAGHAPFLRSLLDAGRHARRRASRPRPPPAWAASAPACRRARTGWSATRCSSPSATCCSTSCPGSRRSTRARWQPRRRRCSSGRRRRASQVVRDRAGVLRRLRADRGGAARRARSSPADSLDARVDAAPGRLRSAPRGRWSTSTGATSTRSATSTAAGPGSGARSWPGSTTPSAAWPSGLPRDATLHVTADHGMVDVADAPAHRPGARAGAGRRRPARRRRAARPAAVLRAGAAEDVLRGLDGAAGRPGLGAAAGAGGRRRLVRAGRAATCSPGSVTSSWRRPATSRSSTPRHQRPQLLALIGLHGSLTPEESAVPLLSVRRRARSR